MKNNRTYTCLITSFFLIFFLISYGQTPVIQDSLRVEWEQLDGPPGHVFKYAESNGKMFAGTDAGLFISNNEGKNWKLNSGLGKLGLLNFFVTGNTVIAVSLDIYYQPSNYSMLGQNYVTTKIKIFRSIDQGIHWEEKTLNNAANYSLNTEFKPSLIFSNDSIITCIIKVKEGGYNRFKAWQSRDMGLTWTSAWTDSKFVHSVNVASDTIFGSWRSSHTGTANFSGFIVTNGDFNHPQDVDTSTLPDDFDEEAIALYRNGIFSFVSRNRKIFQTVDFGAHWTTGTLMIPDNINTIKYDDTTYYLLTKTDVWKGDMDAPFDFNRIYHRVGGSDTDVYTFSSTNSGYWVNSGFGNTYFSSDAGYSWQTRSKGLVASVENLTSFCGKLVEYYDVPLSSNNYSKFISNTEGGEWLDAHSIQFKNILGEVNGVIFSYIPLRRSFDCGLSWDTISYPDVVIQAAPEKLIQDDNRLYLLNKSGAPILYSDNNGASWLELSEPEPFVICEDIVILGDTILMLTNSGGQKSLYRTFNLGQSWQKLSTSPFLESIYLDSNKKIVGTVVSLISSSTPYLFQGKIFISEDFGNSWILTYSSDPQRYFRPDNSTESIVFPLIQDDIIFMVNSDGTSVSYDYGIHWTLLSDLPFTYAVFDKNATGAARPLVYAGGTDNYKVLNGYLYAATASEGIWRTPFAPIRDHVKVTGKAFGFLKGLLFTDIDGDCLFDLASGDKPLGNKPIHINPGNIYTNTDASGNYRLALPTGTYSITSTPPLYCVPFCSGDTVEANVTAGETIHTNLSFSAMPGKVDLGVLITTPIPARPGLEVYYKLQVTNLGTESVSDAVVTFSFDPTILIPAYLSPLGQFSGNYAKIQLPLLHPGDAFIITFGFIVSPSVPLGQQLVLTADCPVPNDQNPGNNTCRITQTITGSFDPNDKNAEPVLATPPDHPRMLDYLIRFQNTGTDTAFKVIIIDTLDQQLDAMTLRTIEASHDYRFSLLSDNVCRWEFRHILLPDSTTNELASHGYLRFQVQTVAGIVPDHILNDADIYFDFNSPVTTNEVSSLNPKWVVHQSNLVTLCTGDSWNGQNWFYNTIVVDTTGNLWTDTISITDVQVLPTAQTQFDTILAVGGQILGTTILNDTTLSVYLTGSNGCDSVVTWNVFTEISSALSNPEFEAISFKIIPNPATVKAVATFHLNETATEMNLKNLESAEIKISSPDGRLIRHLSYVEVISGVPQILFDLTDWSAGVYFLTIEAQTFKLTGRFVKI